MPKGPKGEKRPGDVIGAAIRVARIATGEEPEAIEDDGKDPAAKALGAKGGAARAKKLSAEQRREIAKKAAKIRWAAKSDDGVYPLSIRKAVASRQKHGASHAQYKID